MPAVTHPTYIPEDAGATQLANAKVGVLVPLIRPFECEKHFWTSVFFNAAAESHDTLHLFLRLVCECLLLFRLQAGVPSDIVRPFNILTSKAIVLIVVHIALKAILPGMYMECRWIILAHFRLYALLIVLSCVMSIRAAIADIGVLGARSEVLMQALFMYQAAKGSPTLATARALLLVSQCNQSLLHGLMPVVPFLLDIPVHLAYLLIIVRYMSAPVADIFTRPSHAATTHNICRLLTALPTRRAFLPTPPRKSSPTAGPCGVQHVWLIILFFQLFVGACLPLYISYTLERSLKLRFLRHELHHHAAAAAAATIAVTATATPPSNPITSAAAAASTLTTTTTPSTTPTPTAAAATTTLTAAAADPTPPAAQQQQQQQQQPSLLATLGSTPRSHPVVTKARSAQRVAAALLAHLHSGRDPTPGTVRIPAALHWLFSCCFHACMLVLLAALCWQLVADLHVPLARCVKLLAFPGADYGWYWELLCGDDQPCCPA